MKWLNVSWILLPAVMLCVVRPAKADSVQFSFTPDPLGCQFMNCSTPVEGSGVFDVTAFNPGAACTVSLSQVWYGLESVVGQINGEAMTLSYPWTPGFNVCNQSLEPDLRPFANGGALFFTVNNQPWEIVKSTDGPVCSGGGHCIYVIGPTVTEPIAWSAQFIAPEPSTLLLLGMGMLAGLVYFRKEY